MQYSLTIKGIFKDDKPGKGDTTLSMISLSGPLMYKIPIRIPDKWPVQSDKLISQNICIRLQIMSGLIKKSNAC